MFFVFFKFQAFQSTDLVYPTKGTKGIITVPNKETENLGLVLNSKAAPDEDHNPKSRASSHYNLKRAKNTEGGGGHYNVEEKAWKTLTFNRLRGL